MNRVVCTSSLDVVTRNRATATRQRTEADWSELAECNAYAKSKLLAERKAWDLAAGHGIELAVVHPGAIIGPPLQAKKDSSADMVRRMLADQCPRYRRCAWRSLTSATSRPGTASPWRSPRQRETGTSSPMAT